MSVNVISLFDKESGEHLLFKAPADQNLRDAIFEKLEENQELLDLSNVVLKDLHTAFSKTTSIEEITSTLVGYDIQFKFIHVSEGI